MDGTDQGDASSAGGSGRDSEAGSRDTIRGRAEANRVKLWVFVEAHRHVVAVGLLAVVFVAMAAVGTLIPGAADRWFQTDAVDTVFQAFIGATITGVTLVLTLNQLVLSQELGAVGDQRERMSGAMEFRRDAADLLDAPVSPHEPSAFLGDLIERAGDHATALHDSVRSDADPDTAERIDQLADAVEKNASAASEQIDGAQFGTFDVVSAALDFNYSEKIYAARRLQAEDAGALTEEGRNALEALIETLVAFGPAREHLKTLYIQWELIDLSRALLASAVPALLISASMVLYYNVSRSPATVVGLDVPVLVVSASTALAALPFLVLLAHVLRIATVTKRTLSIGPFTLRRTDGNEP
jgi:hypothetical protein